MTSSRKVFENWFQLQRQMIAGLQRAYLQVQGPAVPEGKLILQHPTDLDSTREDLAPAAHLAIQSQAPVNSTLQADTETRRVRIAFPLGIEHRLSGAIVVEVSSTAGQQGGLNSLLQWGATWLEALLDNPAASSAENECADLAAILANPDFPSLLTATLATLKHLSGADRVACGIEYNGKVTLEGISEIVDLDRRSPDALAIVDSMQQTSADEHGWSPPAPAPAEAPPPARATRDRQSAGENLVTSRHPGTGGENLIFTFAFTDRDGGNEWLAARCRAMATLISPALALQRQRRGGWLQRLARLLREGLSDLLSPLNRWRRLGYIAAGIVLLALMLSSTDYRVTAKAVIEAASQQTMAVPFESFIAEAPVRAGEAVSEGALLVRLDDRELKTRQRGLLAEAVELRKKRRQAMATGKLSEARVLEARFEQVRARLALVEEQLQQTEIRSPLDGIVISGDWQRAIGAPVARGDTLFELAPLNSYRTVLLVEDRDIAQLAPAQTGALILAAMPSQPLALEISDIVSIADADELNALFRVEALLREEPPALRPGMEGIAKIVAGERPRWWVWSHDLSEWLQLQWWRWLP